MEKIVASLFIVGLLTGCGTQQVNSPKSQTAPSPIVPIWMGNVEHVTVDTYLVDSPKQPIGTVDISSKAKEREIVYEIDSSKSIPLPTPGTTVVTPSVGPNSLSFKVIVWLKTGYPRIFKVGSWGPTYDTSHDEDLSPGLSRKLLKKLSPPIRSK